MGVCAARCPPSPRAAPEPRAGDDWDAYRPAQLNLLHTLQRHAAATKGCYIVITGDYHYSDIKVAKPGQQLYSAAYETDQWSTPIYQVVSPMPCWSLRTFGAYVAGWMPQMPWGFTAASASWAIQQNALTDTCSLPVQFARWRAA